MLLNDIPLYLKMEEFDRKYKSDFLFRGRYFSVFLRRKLKEIRFHSDFCQICVVGSFEPRERCRLVEKSALIEVFFDHRVYDSLEPMAHHEFFARMFIEGVERCSRDFEVPCVEIMGWIDEFRQLQFTNQWRHSRKLLRGAGATASLLCEIDSNKFTLTLQIEQKKVCMYERVILETLPDELIYAHQFKDVVVKGNEIVVRDRNQCAIFSVPLDVITGRR